MCPLLFKVEFSCAGASPSPAAAVADALPLLGSKQPNVAVLLSLQSPGEAERASGRVHEQHCAFCIAAAVAAGNMMAEESSRCAFVLHCIKVEH